MSDFVICNLCGNLCALTRADGVVEDKRAGLQNAEVSGGYHSTAGNGYGALDDMTSYHFSLCEFCLDWLFSQFVVPVKMTDYGTGNEESEEKFRPAEVRVREDEWRSYKSEFFLAFNSRNADRGKTK